jgi:DNA-binding PadR family transcriptional regulator
MITNSELAILGLVAENPQHGYQIEAEITQRGMRNWTEIGFSSIYYVLNKMEESGWLSSAKQTSGDRPTRKVYRLTTTGEEIFHQAVFERFSQPRPRTGDYALALANLPALTPDEICNGLENHLKSLKEQIDSLQNKWEADQSQNMPHHVNYLFNYSLNLLQSETVWVENFLNSQKGKNNNAKD